MAESLDGSITGKVFPNGQTWEKEDQGFTLGQDILKEAQKDSDVAVD